MSAASLGNMSGDCTTVKCDPGRGHCGLIDQSDGSQRWVDAGGFYRISMGHWDKGTFNNFSDNFYKEMNQVYGYYTSPLIDSENDICSTIRYSISSWQLVLDLVVVRRGFTFTEDHQLQITDIIAQYQMDGQNDIMMTHVSKLPKGQFHIIFRTKNNNLVSAAEAHIYNIHLSTDNCQLQSKSNLILKIYIC